MRIANDQAVEGWHERMRKLDELQTIALGHMKEAHDRQKRFYDEHHRDVHFNLGDKVFRKNRVLPKAADKVAGKLAPAYVGPYVVTKKTGEKNVRAD